LTADENASKASRKPTSFGRSCNIVTSRVKGSQTEQNREK
jgi:hypothetical protein